ncbi:FtsX-like permease family protein [Nocardioides sp. R-C-SC26]|uniref:ABC transporter permease n=1 Tax=Nocardioides sp. R-C-SC26 TaxID=2870414 RepID=UPI001E370170|nr:FtsX-like permease family protein [Nocardioides sp. R-C-SC26]
MTGSSAALLALLRSQLRRHPGRAWALGATIALAVTLLTSAFVLAASLRTAIDQGLEVSYEGTDVIVRTELGTSDSELSGGVGLVSFDDEQLAELADLDGVAAASSYTRATAVARTGDNALGIALESQPADESFQWQRWSQGRAPVPGQPEVGLTQDTLDQLHIGLGDLVSLGTPSLGAANLRVSGIVDVRGSLGYSGTAYGVVPEATARLLAGVTGANVVVLRAEPGVAAVQIQEEVNAAGQGGFAQTTQELIDGAGSAEQVRLAGIDAVLFSFSPLALVVAAIVMGTSILVSLGSRRRYLALLRSIGATRRQTFALLLSEVLALGAVGSVVGAAVGVALARLALPLTGLIPGLPAVSGSAFTVPWPGVVISLGAGVALSAVAGLLPAWTASRVSPAAVLSSTASPSAERRRGANLAVVLLMLGLAATVVGLTGERSGWAIAGLLVTVIGTLLSFGFSVSLTAQVISRRLREGRRTVPQLAANGLAREPGRAAAEGVAVLLATTLIAGTWVLMSSLHAAGSQRLDALPVPDLTVGAPVGSVPLGPDALERFEAIDGVETVVTLPQGAEVTVQGPGERGDVTLSTGVIGQDLSELLEALPAGWGIDELADDTVYLPNDYFKAFVDGARVSLVGPAGTVEDLQIVYLDDFDLPALVSPALLADVASVTEVRTAWLRLADGVDRAAVLAEVSGAAVLAGQVPVGGPALLDLKLSRGIAVTTATSTGFLAVALLVAVVGAVLVTVVSVAERWHEHAVLRALGLERPQLRRLLLFRTQFVALAAAVLGVGLGLLVGLSGSTLLTRALDVPAAPSVPVLPILILSVLVVAVVRAAVLVPLERAAHVSPASALSQGAS